MSDADNDLSVAMNELPDTGRFALAHPDAMMTRHHQATAALVRWADRTDRARREEAEDRKQLRAEVRRWVIGAALGAIGSFATLIWQAATARAELTELRTTLARMERGDTTTHASERSEP